MSVDPQAQAAPKPRLKELPKPIPTDRVSMSFSRYRRKIVDALCSPRVSRKRAHAVVREAEAFIHGLWRKPFTSNSGVTQGSWPVPKVVEQLMTSVHSPLFA